MILCFRLRTRFLNLGNFKMRVLQFDYIVGKKFKRQISFTNIAVSYLETEQKNYFLHRDLKAISTFLFYILLEIASQMRESVFPLKWPGSTWLL